METKEATHTPTPWWGEQSGFGGEFLRPPVTPDGDDRAIGSINRNEDATFIVKAVNSHEALLKAAKSVLNNSEQDLFPIDIKRLLNAIALAEGK